MVESQRKRTCWLDRAAFRGWRRSFERRLQKDFSEFLSLWHKSNHFFASVLNPLNINIEIYGIIDIIVNNIRNFNSTINNISINHNEHDQHLLSEMTYEFFSADEQVNQPEVVQEVLADPKMEIFHDFAIKGGGGGGGPLTEKVACH